MTKKKQTVVKGYKVTNPNSTCIGYKYEVGKTYKHEGRIELCSYGFHFCQKANHCFNYYPFDSNNLVYEVEAVGEVINGDDKSVTNELRIVKLLTWQEALIAANLGKDNTGHSNSGDSNSGHRNSGDRNSGHRNSGHSNSGDRNSGHWNSGDRNSGHRNSGHSNSGDRNSGDSNSGNRNSGDSNSGHWNSTNHSSGVFNSQEQKITMFNKPSDWTFDQWLRSDAYNLLCNMTLTEWVYFSDMTEEEKIAEPKAYVRDGYLKKHSYKDACAKMWSNFNTKQRNTITSLPNFDAEVFKEITGIDINQ